MLEFRGSIVASGVTDGVLCTQELETASLQISQTPEWKALEDHVAEIETTYVTLVAFLVYWECST